VGDGTLKKKLQHYANAEGVTSITFEDAVPRTEIPNLLASADILVANTPNHDLYRYGTSLNKLYEYLAAARPIALASSAVGDPITAAGVGPVVPPDDPDALAERIITLASISENERGELGIKGRQYVEQEHDYKQLAKRVLLCLQRVVHS
jgi:glycosyltransferase involved in cell wall biosynthesis